MPILNAFLRRFSRDETPRLAAATAFYTLIGLAPFLLLIVTIAAQLGNDDQSSLISQAHLFVGPEAAAAVQTILAAVHTRSELRSAAGISSVLVWSFSSSLLFIELQSALTRIFDGRPIRKKQLSQTQRAWGFLKARLFSLALVFIFTFVAVVSLFVSSYLAYLMRDHSVFAIRALNVAVSYVVYFGVFLFAYSYLPLVRVSARRATFGALMTSVLFVIGKELIGLYLGKMAFGSIYGAAGTLMVLLVWIYYSALIIFAGAQLTMIVIPDRRVDLGAPRPSLDV